MLWNWKFSNSAAASFGNPRETRIPIPVPTPTSAMPLRIIRRSTPAGSAPKAKRIPKGMARSEEHTSELQSRENLVCRLLLEKKNKKQLAENQIRTQQSI